MSGPVDDALVVLTRRIFNSASFSADDVGANALARVRDELERLRQERDAALDREAGTSDALDGMREQWKAAGETAKINYERALAAEHDLAMERSLNADYKAANEQHLAALADMRRALECDHDEERWKYVEHEGKTWQICRDCGLMELWEGGTRFAQRVDSERARALAAADEGYPETFAGYPVEDFLPAHPTYTPSEHRYPEGDEVREPDGRTLHPRPGDPAYDEVADGGGQEQP